MSNVAQGDDYAKDIIELYFDIFENHRDTFVYYLSDSATLDWFGQTVKGQSNITTFVKNKIGKVTHQFLNPKEVSNIGYRDTHIVKPIRDSKAIATPTENEAKILKDTSTSKQDLSIPSSSHFIEKGQGDGLHNCPISESPIKKTRLDTEETVKAPLIKYISVDGHVEFYRRSSKKLQQETKWTRPSQLQFAYSGSNKRDFILYLIIYQGNTKCRRNLMKEFETDEPLN